MTRRPPEWDSEVHDEEELWVCPHCDAHLHVDSVGEKCPVCGEDAEDAEIER